MAQPLNFPSEIKWLFLFHKGENMSNTKKKYGVRISVLEYGYYEVEAKSKESRPENQDITRDIEDRDER